MLKHPNNKNVKTSVLIVTAPVVQHFVCQKNEKG